MTVHEQKTGRTVRVYIGKRLLADIERFAQRSRPGEYLFPHRLDPTRHRTRQAVFLDVQKCRDLLGLDCHVSPHSFRKLFAVRMYERVGDLQKVQRRLGHKKLETTILYALSDCIKTKT